MGRSVGPVGSELPEVLELGQFWRNGHDTYCFRTSCDGCQYSEGCSWKEQILKIGPGLNIRRAFIARPGFKWVSIDYKQIELRVAAQLSQEPVWVKAFQDNADLHTEMAKLAFKTDSPTKAQRDSAKSCNFGNLFGGTPQTLAQNSDLSEPEAIFVHREWWEALPVYKSWFERQFLKALHDRYVETFFGRRRHLERLIREIEEEELGKRSKPGTSKRGRGFVRRTSVNSPIQGTAADLMKIALIRVHKWIKRHKKQDDVKILLSVHDELDLEVRDDDNLYANCREIAKQMCPPIEGWTVPIGTDIEIGDNWAELSDIEDLEKSSSSTVSIDQPQQEKPNKRCATLVVSTVLTEAMQTKLKCAILEAEAVQNVVQVPLKMQVMGNLESLQRRVSEPVLRRGIKGLTGITLCGT